MFTLLTIISVIVFYLVVAGATHGYAKHRWPPKIVRRQLFVQGFGLQWQEQDDSSTNRTFATVFWPFYWIFVWTFTKVNEITFDTIEKRAGHQLAMNQARIADLRATREQLEASNAELEAAEADLDREIAKKL